MSYANHPPCTPILQGYRAVRKSKQTMKVTSQLTNGNKIRRKIGNIKYKDMIRGSRIKDPSPDEYVRQAETLPVWATEAMEADLAA